MDGIVTGKIEKSVNTKTIKVLNELSVFNSFSQYQYIGNSTFTPPLFDKAYSGKGSEIYVELTGKGNVNAPLYIPLFSAYYIYANSTPSAGTSMNIQMYAENQPSNPSRYDVGTSGIIRYSYCYENGYIYMYTTSSNHVLSEYISRIRIITLS